MTDTTLTSKQPSSSELDYADPTKFKFTSTKLPKVEFNTIQANVPGITLTELTQPTRLMPVRIPGNDLTFEDLTITFIVDENLINYRSVHDWMAALAQVDSDDKYRELVASGNDRMPLSTQSNLKDAGRVTKATPDGAIFSDSRLIVLSGRNIPIVEITFRDCYPKSLSALDYNQQSTDIEYLTATATFGYKLHEYTTPF
jgi:hypothetical protein